MLSRIALLYQKSAPAYQPVFGRFSQVATMSMSQEAQENVVKGGIKVRARAAKHYFACCCLLASNEVHRSGFGSMVKKTVLIAVQRSLYGRGISLTPGSCLCLQSKVS